MASILGFIKRNYTAVYPTPVPKSPNALRFGILGAANIGPLALFMPAKTHPDVVVRAVAARSKTKAEAYAKKHGIPVVLGSYQELVDDPEIDVIYNALPNGSHYEWTMKALAAGKHVLLEKPAANTAEETTKMFEFAGQKGVVLLEAFHYRFHPAVQRLKQIVDSGEIGTVQSIQASLMMPDVVFAKDDIRFDHALGGGAMMDMGCYTMSVIRYLGGAPTEVLSATHTLRSALVDRRTDAHLALASGATAKLTCDLAVPLTYGVLPGMPKILAVVKGERGEASLFNFLMPTIYHTLSVIKTDGGSSQTRTEKVYVADGRGEPSWTTYRHQLECFVDKVRGREPSTWVSAEDSAANMHWIEEVYKKGGLGSRPASDFTLT